MKNRKLFVAAVALISFTHSNAQEGAIYLDESQFECELVLGVFQSTHSEEYKVNKIKYSNSHTHSTAGLYDREINSYFELRTSEDHSPRRLNPKKNFTSIGKKVVGLSNDGWLGISMAHYIDQTNTCLYQKKKTLKNEDGKLQNSKIVYGLTVPDLGCYCIKFNRRFDVLAERLYGDRITQVQSLLLSELELLKTQNEISEDDYQLLKSRLIDDLRTHFVEREGE